MRESHSSDIIYTEDLFIGSQKPFNMYELMRVLMTLLIMIYIYRILCELTLNSERIYYKH